MADHQYKLLYQIERKPEGFSAEEAHARSKQGYGACDALLLASIIYPKDGSLSVFFIGHDGRTDAELADHEWFKVWMMLTSRLAQSTTLESGRRAFCTAVFTELVQAICDPPGD